MDARTIGPSVASDRSARGSTARSIGSPPSRATPTEMIAPASRMSALVIGIGCNLANRTPKQAFCPSIY